MVFRGTFQPEPFGDAAAPRAFREEHEQPKTSRERRPQNPAGAEGSWRQHRPQTTPLTPRREAAARPDQPEALGNRAAPRHSASPPPQHSALYSKAAESARKEVAQHPSCWGWLLLSLSLGVQERSLPD